MMKSLLSKIVVKLYSLQRKTLSENNRKKFFQNSENKIHHSFKIGADNFIDISKTSEIMISEDVVINESNNIAIKGNAKFSIGKGTYITRVTIGCVENIEIGENCLIGEGSKIFDMNHAIEQNPFKISKTNFNSAPIKIGNNVWTGANCIILKGVTIGDNVVLGAGCIIYKDIPANSMVINKQELVVKPL